MQGEVCRAQGAGCTLPAQTSVQGRDVRYGATPGLGQAALRPFVSRQYCTVPLTIPSQWGPAPAQHGAAQAAGAACERRSGA